MSCEDVSFQSPGVAAPMAAFAAAQLGSVWSIRSCIVTSSGPTNASSSPYYPHLGGGGHPLIPAGGGYQAGGGGGALQQLLHAQSQPQLTHSLSQPYLLTSDKLSSSLSKLTSTQAASPNKLSMSQGHLNDSITLSFHEQVKNSANSKLVLSPRNSIAASAASVAVSNSTSNSDAENIHVVGTGGVRIQVGGSTTSISPRKQVLTQNMVTRILFV